MLTAILLYVASQPAGLVLTPADANWEPWLQRHAPALELQHDPTTGELVELTDAREQAVLQRRAQLLREATASPEAQRLLALSPQEHAAETLRYIKTILIDGNYGPEEPEDRYDGVYEALLYTLLEEEADRIPTILAREGAFVYSSQPEGRQRRLPRAAMARFAEIQEAERLIAAQAITLPPDPPWDWDYVADTILRPSLRNRPSSRALVAVTSIFPWVTLNVFTFDAEGRQRTQAGIIVHWDTPPKLENELPRLGTLTLSEPAALHLAAQDPERPLPDDPRIVEWFTRPDLHEPFSFAVQEVLNALSERLKAPLAARLDDDVFDALLRSTTEGQVDLDAFCLALGELGYRFGEAGGRRTLMPDPARPLFMRRVDREDVADYATQPAGLRPLAKLYARTDRPWNAWTRVLWRGKPFPTLRPTWVEPWSLRVLGHLGESSWLALERGETLILGTLPGAARRALLQWALLHPTDLRTPDAYLAMTYAGSAFAQFASGVPERGILTLEHAPGWWVAPPDYPDSRTAVYEGWAQNWMLDPRLAEKPRHLEDPLSSLESTTFAYGTVDRSLAWVFPSPGNAMIGRYDGPLDEGHPPTPWANLPPALQDDLQTSVRWMMNLRDAYRR